MMGHYDTFTSSQLGWIVATRRRVQKYKNTSSSGSVGDRSTFFAVVSTSLSSCFLSVLANLNLLFRAPHVALGGRPDFTSDTKNHAKKKQTLFVFIRHARRKMTTVAAGRSYADLNPTTFDHIFFPPAIWQVIKGRTERHQSTTNRLASTRIVDSLQIGIWKQKHFIHHFINQLWISNH